MTREYEIPMPKWELSDPFGRAAIKSLRYDLKKALCERDGYRVQVEEILKEQGNAVRMLANALSREQEVTKELTRRLEVSEEARKSLGEKNRRLHNDMDEQVASRAKMRIEHERLKELYGALLKEHDELQAEHENLVRSITDKDREVVA